jgi:hypothetical protein
MMQRMARRRTRKKTREKRKTRNPGDYEAELVRLCKGNRKRAEALILEALEQAPTMSRQGAAMMVVTRLRHEVAPVRRTL